MEEKKEQIFFTMVRKLVRKKSPATTIEAVAKEAGLKKGSYWTYRKKGNLPRADVAVKIAGILNTTVEELVTGKKTVLSENSAKRQKDMDQILDELEEAIKLYREKAKSEKTIKKRHKEK